MAITSQTPTVEIVIVGLNEAHNLPRTIAAAQITAGFAEQELGIVTRLMYIDSGSEDSSKEIARQLGVETFDAHPGFRTVGNGRTSGYLIGQGNIIMFLDADCELDRDWLVNGIRFLEEHEEAAGVVGIEDKIRFVGNGKNLIPNYGKIKEPVSRMPYESYTGSCLLRRSALEATGGYEPDINTAEDRLLHFHLVSLGTPIYQIASPMIVHWDNHLRNPDSGLEKFFRMSKSATNRGAIIRYALRRREILPMVLSSMRHEIIHAVFLFVCMLILVSGFGFVPTQIALRVFLVIFVIYFVWQMLRKRSLFFGLTALILESIYVIGMLYALLFNRPKPNWGVQRTVAYRNELLRANQIMVKD